jgi:hypothetical protein
VRKGLGPVGSVLQFTNPAALLAPARNLARPRVESIDRPGSACSDQARAAPARDPIRRGAFVWFTADRQEEFRSAMTIYVGNLDYAVTSDELRALFEPFGAVASSDVQVKSRTGQSRGFGIIEMPQADEARAAIEALNNREHRDRPLTVNESRPRRTVRDLYAGGGWYGGGGGG